MNFTVYLFFKVFMAVNRVSLIYITHAILQKHIHLHFFAYENLWRHIWQCLQLYANTCNYGNACKKMQIHGNICKYVRIHGNARKCAKTCINICRFILSSLTYACNRGCCCIKSKWHLLCTSQPRWYRHEKLLTDEINQMGCGRLFKSFDGRARLTDEWIQLTIDVKCWNLCYFELLS